jgi:hypothetical protein
MKRSPRIEAAAGGQSKGLIELAGIHIDNIKAVLLGVAAKGVQWRIGNGGDIYPVEIKGVSVLPEEV